MNRKLIIGRYIFMFTVLVTLIFISAVLASPIFEETSKGGFFNKKDNSGHIFNSLLFIAGLSLFWITIEKNKGLPNQAHHLGRFIRCIYVWVFSDVLRLASIVIILTLFAILLLIPVIL